MSWTSAASWEKESGVLAPGRWADVTVMDIDPLVTGESDPGGLLRGSILATIVAGKVAYAADTLGKAQASASAAPPAHSRPPTGP